MNNSTTDKMNKLTIGDRDRVNDSLFQTKRSKLHENRKDINENINKEMRMKAGARNLVDLTKDKKMKSKINIEIDYFESNLKLWKEELEKANSALDTYQNMKHGLPMIPIAMKNTVEIDFTKPFQTIISNHYCDDAEKYSESIEQLNLKRKKIQKPQRNDRGIEDHIGYLNTIKHIEKRFFFLDKSNGIIFSWNDIFTGVPFQQRTIMFEKSGIIFNLAALYSQLAAGKDKSKKEGLENAQIYLLSAESCFNFLINNFLNAPSVDLKPEILKMLASLMKTQAMECKLLLLTKKKEDNNTTDKSQKTPSKAQSNYEFDNLHCLELVSESYILSLVFDSVYSSVHLELLQHLEHIPQSWINLMQVKANYYRAMSYQLLAYRYNELGHLSDEMTTNSWMQRKKSMTNRETKHPAIVDLSTKLKPYLKSTKYQIQLAGNSQEAYGTAKMLLKEALQMMEEAIKLAAMNSYLRNLHDLSTFLQNQHKEWLGTLHLLNDSDSYDLLTCPELSVSCQMKSGSEFTFNQLINRRPQVDPFRGIGPIEVFNSRYRFGSIRCLMIVRDQVNGFGFTVKGNGPVRVVDVERGSNAEKSGLKVGDIVLSIGESDMRWSNQDELVQRASKEGTIVRLTVTSVSSIEPPSTPTSMGAGTNLSRYHTVSGGDYTNYPSTFDDVSSTNNSNGNIYKSLNTPTNIKKNKLTWKQRLTGTWKRNRRKNTLTSQDSGGNSTLTGPSTATNNGPSLKAMNIAKSHSHFYQPTSTNSVPASQPNTNSNITSTPTSSTNLVKEKKPNVTLF